MHVDTSMTLSVVYTASVKHSILFQCLCLKFRFDNDLIVFVYCLRNDLDIVEEDIESEESSIIR